MCMVLLFNPVNKAITYYPYKTQRLLNSTLYSNSIEMQHNSTQDLAHILYRNRPARYTCSVERFIHVICYAVKI